MIKTGIIGGGFTGTMTAVQLIQKADQPCEITIINERETFNKGIAFSAYSKKHLLNVIAGKMSAFADKPNHFTDWVINKKEFAGKDEALIANSFLPRTLYGEYLTAIWKDAEAIAKAKNIVVNVIDSFVIDLDAESTHVLLHLENGQRINVNNCVIATGNNIPHNLKIKSPAFYESKNYFQNPWLINCVKNNNNKKPILIVGNGLTMVDTVLGLLEQGFAGEIYSISPNGFNILPHRHNGTRYSKFTEELTDDISFLDLVKLINKHIKSVREFGLSAEPVIDSIRPYTQKIWKRLTDKEKQLFMGRLRHLWGVARHRIPLHTHDKIQQLRIDGRLHINSGKIIDFEELSDKIKVTYLDKKDGTIKHIEVGRIINCTGPETDLMKVDNSFLKNCLLKGILTQDTLKLGISADTSSFQVRNAEGKLHTNLFTLGSNLKGELWESTAVNELRTQAEMLSRNLTSHLNVTEKRIA